MQSINQNYYVHKFGGSSVGNADRFAALKSLLSGKNEVIVVSAMQGTTSSLQLILDAAKQNQSYVDLLLSLEKKHLDVIDSLQLNADDIIKNIKNDFSEISDILNAVKLTAMYSTEIQNIILGYGELWSAQILSRYLSTLNDVLYIDASKVLFVFEKYGMISIDWEKSSSTLQKLLENKKFDQIVITGFIAATLDGKRTTLGRNGSDYSAAIFAKLFNAKGLTIWTDVDGIFTADPNKVRSAFVIESLSYHEALELAYFGAKVLHPMTIAPVYELQIPMLIKNSFNPEAKGTCISSSSGNSPYLIKGLSSIDNIALINIEGAGMIGVSGIATRIFSILHQKNISVILIAQASSEHSICFSISENQADHAVQALQEYLKYEIANHHIQNIHVDRSCAILSAVGDGMIGTAGVSEKLCGSLARANINIRALSQGSSERNISVVLNRSDIGKALQAIHAGFYLSEESISIGMIGPGQVGSAMLLQLKDTLKKNLMVRGLMSSNKMLLSHQPIDLNTWEDDFQNSNTQSDISEFMNHILADDIPHAVIIDCTANPEIAKHYASFIEKGLHVITPNKHANAGDLQYYKKLKSLTQKKNNHYFYEATVCAGLPVISTLQDIIKTGDKVNKIEGIVSGTLSYIFNELAKNRKFSEVVKEAKKLGFTEPDPREDLSGMDVARKLVCLGRETGFDVNLEDVNVYDLVPSELKSCSIEEFLDKLSGYDEKMSALVAKANANQEKMCYVGTINHDGSMQVAMNAYDASHPFARLNGTDNMLIFHTKRYHKQPLVIQGPGAGAEVTAAGIFADLLRLVSML